MHFICYYNITRKKKDYFGNVRYGETPPIASCIPDRFVFWRHWGFRKSWSRKFTPGVERGATKQFLAHRLNRKCVLTVYEGVDPGE